MDGWKADMRGNDKYIERLYIQRFSCVGDGMHIELCIGVPDGKFAKLDKPYPIATIRADKGDERRFVFYTEDGPISVPLVEIERALMIAREEVHSEEFYD